LKPFNRRGGGSDDDAYPRYVFVAVGTFGCQRFVDDVTAFARQAGKVITADPQCVFITQRQPCFSGMFELQRVVGFKVAQRTW
jgi:hypothetical protein